MKHCVCLLLGLIWVFSAIGASAADGPAPVLFDGRSLDGWEGRDDLWRVEDGAIVGTVSDSLDRNEFLVNRHVLGDFRLIVEVKLATVDNNSGIQFRSRKIEDGGRISVAGYQADIGGPNDRFWGMLYDEHGRGWLSRNSAAGHVHRGTWNTYEILAVGGRIRTAVNGRMTVDLEDPEGARRGVIALQLHSGGPIEVRFRNFRLEPDPRPELRTLESGRNVYAWAPGTGYTVEQAAQAMTVPEGFVVDPVAGEPRVHQPIAMAFDARGRLWIAEAHSYPARRPEGEGLDKILIFEDTTGDGRYDSRKLFIDGLNLVSGMEVGFGGVWVGAAPHLMFIPDRDGDDAPDGEPEVLLDGWGVQDTHETINSLIWGPDGWLYGCQGVFIRSLIGRPGAPDDQRTPLSCGVWRYHPTRREFEVFAHGGSNQWGVDFDDWGQAFMPTCRSHNGGGPVTHIVQGGYYWRQAGDHAYPHAYQHMKASADHGHGLGGAGGSRELYGGHAHCGAMVYLGDNWPAMYRNRLLFNNVHGKRLNQEINIPSGSGYVTRHADDDFLYANDPWFMGVNLRYGPDGAVYLIDWYDRQACHHRDIERWDRTNGRIFRIRYGEVEPLDADLAALPDRRLVELQLHRNDWYVRTARRLLQRRAAGGGIDDAAYRDLLAIVRENPDTTRRLRAMWALHAIGRFDDELTLALLRDDDPHVRAWTVQLTLEDRRAPAAIVDRFAEMAYGDEAPLVRLYLASGLRRLPTERRWLIAEALLTHAEDADDRNIPFMIWFGVEPLVPADLGRAMRLAAGSRIPLVAGNIYRRAALESDGLDGLVALLGEAGSADRQRFVLSAIAEALRGRRDLPMPPAWPAVAPDLYASGDPSIHREAQKLAARFGDRTVFPEMRRLLADGEAPLDRRRHAFEVLLVGRDAGAAAVFHALLDDEAFRGDAIAALAAFDHPDTAAELLERYGRFTDRQRREALGALVGRPAWAAALLDAIAAGSVPKDDLTPFLAREIANLNDEAVSAKLAAVWGANRRSSGDKRAEIERYKRIYRRSADWMFSAERGRRIYDQLCATCHLLHGEGAEIGPDLTGSNRGDLDYLLENIVDPNALVGRDYQLTVVRLNDGRVLSGMILRRDDRTLTLQTLSEPIVIQREDVAEMQTLPMSLMPEGLLAGLSDEQFQNLIKYLRSDHQVPPAPDPGR